MSQSFSYKHLGDRASVMSELRRRKLIDPDFTVIDVGAAQYPWSAEVLDATLDLNVTAVAPVHFKGNLNDVRQWDRVLDYVAKHDKFSYAICSHTLEDLAYPAMTLEMLPHIAHEGFIAVPSIYLESIHPEGTHRGYIHHRWLLDSDDDQKKLFLLPKLPFLENFYLEHRAQWVTEPHRFELQMRWEENIDFEVVNDDYLGPNLTAVVDMYQRFLNKR